MNSLYNNAPPLVDTVAPQNMYQERKPGRGNRKRRRNVGPESFGPSGNKKSKLEVPNKQRLPQHGYPMEHPFNKDGYRYVLAEPDPSIPDTEPESDLTNKPIPSKQYRRKISNKVLLTLHDRAPTLKVSDDRLSATGEKGYALLRASHSVTKGSWYYEVTVKQMPTGSASRIGWSQKLGNLQAPLGYDKFGYSWRSRKGTRFHQAKGIRYSGAYEQGDILGCHIYIPETNKQQKPLNLDTCKENALIKFKSFFYFEEKDDVEKAEKKLKPMPGSFIEFFKNGVSQGKVWKNEVNCGEYYPCLSIFKNCQLTANFGPVFKFPPRRGEFKLRPMCERAFETVVESSVTDLLYAVALEVDGEK